MKPNSRRTASAAGLLAAVLCIQPAAACAGDSTLPAANSFDPPGVIHSQTYGINPRCDIVGGYRDNSGYDAYPLSNSVYTRFDLPGLYNDATFHTHGFLLMKGAFTTFDVLHATGTIPVGINSRGRDRGVVFESCRRLHVQPRYPQVA